MGDIKKFKRPDFDFEACLDGGRSLSELADELQRSTDRARPLRDIALERDAFSGPWGDEFRKRASEDDDNVAEVITCLRGDAEQWGVIWHQAAVQTNNVAYCEAVLIEADKIQGVRDEDRSLLENALDDWMADGNDPVDFVFDTAAVYASAAFEPYYQAGRWIASWFEPDAMAEALKKVHKPDRVAAVPTEPADFAVRGSDFIQYSGSDFNGWFGRPGPEQRALDAAEFDECEEGTVDPYKRIMDLIFPPPPPIEVSDPRPTLGADDGCCSINLDKVDNYLSEFGPTNGRFIQPALDAQIEDTQHRTTSAKEAVTEYGDTLIQLGLPAIGLYTSFQERNVAALYVVRQSVGPNRSGTVQVSNAFIGAVLKHYGLDQAPGLIKINRPEFHGLPPNSGFVDDPVCAANGNFVHQEIDLAMPGFAEVISARRMYNAASSSLGLFGLGWSSVIDMYLHVDGDRALARLIDGAQISFNRNEDGSFNPERSRRLSLEATDDGFVLTEGYDTTWRFDDEGALVGGTEGRATWSVDFGETAIVVSESLSGRTMTYELDPESGLVIRAITSDGRIATWSYDERLCCVGVDCPTGGSTYSLDDDLRIVAISDADGVEFVHNVYDPWGRVASQLNPFGRESAYEYSDDGTTRVVEADTRELASQMAHDAKANLLSIVGADGGVMRMTWNDEARLAQLTDRKGQTTSYEYVEGALVDLITRTVRADGTEERNEWDDQGRLVRHIDAGGGVATYEYEGDNRVASRITDATGAVTTQVLDERGMPISVIDPDGVVVHQAWDSDGQMLSIGAADGTAAHFTYDAAGQLSTVVGVDGSRTQFSSDAAGNVLTSEDVTGERSYTYTPAGRVLSSHRNGQLEWSIEYGDHGEAARRFDAEQNPTDFEYDGFGRCVAVVVDGSRFENHFDPLGQLLGISINGVRVSTTDYDLNGNWIRRVDADGVATTREVDAMDRTTRVMRGDVEVLAQSHYPIGHPAVIRERGIERTIEVDPAGRPLRVITPRGVLTMTYTPAGRLASRTTAAGRTSTYAYNDAGQLTSITDADGIVSSVNESSERLELLRDGDEVALDFDELGRVTSWSGYAGSGTTTWGDGRVEIAQGTQNPAIIEADHRGRAVRTTDPAGAVATLRRDRLGRLEMMETVGERVTLDYNDVGVVEAYQSSGGENAAFDRSPAGRIDKIMTDGEQAITVVHDEVNGELAALLDESQQPLVSYTRDQAGYVTEISTPDSALAFHHDDSGWMNRIESSIAGSTEWEFDGDGLITAVQSSAGHRIDLTRSAAGRIEQLSSTELSLPWMKKTRTGERNEANKITVGDDGRLHRYDDAGRLIESVSVSGERYAFTYNQASMIESEVTPAGERRFDYDGTRLNRIESNEGLHRFEYDRLGRRSIEFRPNGDEVRYEWSPLDQLTAIEITSADGDVRRRSFLYSGLGRVERVDSTVVHWDELLSSKPIGLGDRTFLRSGTHVCEIGVGDHWTPGVGDDPYGILDDLADIDLGFHGELTVDGLVFMGARIYDPTTRCFLSRDPLAGVLARNGASNPYNFANSDPINRLDPSGLRPISMDEFDEWRDRRMMSGSQRFVQAFVDDPLGSVVLGLTVVAGVAMVATGVGAVAGAAILIGVAVSTGMGIANDNFNPMKTAVDGIVSGLAAATGGAAGAAYGGGAVATAVVTGATAGAVGGFGGSVASQKINDDGSWNDAPLDPMQTITDTVKGAVVGGVAGGMSGKAGEVLRGRNIPVGVADDAAEFAIGTATSAGEQLITEGEVDLGDALLDGTINAGAGRMGRKLAGDGQTPGDDDGTTMPGDGPEQLPPAGDTPAADIPPDTPRPPETQPVETAQPIAVQPDAPATVADTPGQVAEAPAPRPKPITDTPPPAPDAPGRVADTPTPGGTDPIAVPPDTPTPVADAPGRVADTPTPGGSDPIAVPPDTPTQVGDAEVARPRHDGDTRVPTADAEPSPRPRRQDGKTPPPDADGPSFRPDDPIAAPDQPTQPDVPDDISVQSQRSDVSEVLPRVPTDIDGNVIPPPPDSPPPPLPEGPPPADTPETADQPKKAWTNSARGNRKGGASYETPDDDEAEEVAPASTYGTTTVEDIDGPTSARIH